MVKHFEVLWEEAEKVAVEIAPQATLHDDLDSMILSLNSMKNSDSEEQKGQLFGKILFHLCGAAQKLNINSYVALMNHIQDLKQDMLDQQDD